MKEVLRIKLTTDARRFPSYDSTDTDNPWTTIERDASGEYDDTDDIQTPPRPSDAGKLPRRNQLQLRPQTTAYTVDPIAGTTTPIFNAKSETDTITTTVSCRASGRPGRPEHPIGDDAYSDAVDAEGAIRSTRTPGAWSTFGIDVDCPVVATSQPEPDRLDRTTGGDPSETHDVTISNILGG